MIWNYTKDPTYYAALGVSIPAEHAAYYTFNGGTFYLPLSSGPQELRVTGTAFVPAAPMASRAVSRLMHGAAGVHDIETSTQRRRPVSNAVPAEQRATTSWSSLFRKR